jgi:hypothetical protein
MGGYGSTRWGSTSTRQYTGACLRLPVASLRPYLTDDPRRFMEWRWTRESGTSTIGVAMGRDTITLSYRVQRGDDEPQTVRDDVPVKWTPCTYGGERAWLRCPGCDRRVVALHLPPGRERFRCRHCHQLAYGSQQVAPDQRHLMAIRAIQRRLGGEAEGMLPWRVPERPKGMHLRTYARLCTALFEHERKRDAILDAQLCRLLARANRLFGGDAASDRHDD